MIRLSITALGLLLLAAPLGAQAVEGGAGDAAVDAGPCSVANADAHAGLARATPGYANATTRDIASAIAAIWPAHRLERTDRAEYRTRVSRLLATVAELPLFENTAYHK